MTNADILSRAGTILYGWYWRADFCHAFCINERRLRRMIAGTEGLPCGLLQEIETALRDHGIELDALLVEVGEALERYESGSE